MEHNRKYGKIIQEKHFFKQLSDRLSFLLHTSLIENCSQLFLVLIHTVEGLEGIRLVV